MSIEYYMQPINSHILSVLMPLTWIMYQDLFFVYGNKKRFFLIMTAGILFMAPMYVIGCENIFIWEWFLMFTIALSIGAYLEAKLSKYHGKYEDCENEFFLNCCKTAYIICAVVAILVASLLQVLYMQENMIARIISWILYGYISLVYCYKLKKISDYKDNVLGL